MSWIFFLTIAAIPLIWILFKLARSPSGILIRLLRSSASSFISLSNEERRWVVIGLCLTKVLTPALRGVLATEIPKWHQILCQPPTKIDKQIFGAHQEELHPSTLKLNYKNINNNNVHKAKRAFDYTVKDPLSLAKLFVQPFMSMFTGFDETMDISAVLSLIGEAAPFVGAAAHAKTVRSDIRNEWAHCNFANWTEAKFKAAFQSMETLLKNVNLSTKEEQKLCVELNSCKSEGLQLCFTQTVNIEILTLLRGKVDELFEAVQTWNLEKKQVTTLYSNITKIHTNLSKQIDDLYMRVEKNSEEIKHLSRYIKEKEKIPYVFSAPPRNGYFTGRTEEIQKLKGILKVKETLNEKKVRVAAVCCERGIGKTSLVCEYAYQMEDFYKGGAYWFSAKDDKCLDKTVKDIALELKAVIGSFDSTLSNTLRKIGSTDDLSLIVLDCLDQPDLSSNMMKFISLTSQEYIFAHFVVLTKRNPNELVNDVSVFEEDVCLELKCFSSQEAKQFLFSRTGATRDENNENVAESLCDELERKPLALEEVGARIKMFRFSLSEYLQHYKSKQATVVEQPAPNVLRFN